MCGFWVKNNKCYSIVTHIVFVILNPKKFGLTEQEIKRIYARHHEKLFTEGEAREEIIKKVTGSGWIRVREYRDYWSIQFDSIRLRKRNVVNFVRWAITKNIIKKTDKLVLVGFQKNYKIEILARQFIAENRAIPRNAKVILID